MRFDKKNLIVGTNDSGKSSIFKALIFFLESLTNSNASRQRPWDSQVDHEMTVGLALNDEEKRYLVEILSITDKKSGSYRFQLSPHEIIDNLVRRFDDVAVTIRWYPLPFNSPATKVECFLSIEDLGITICSGRSGDDDALVVTDARSDLKRIMNPKSFSETIKDVVIKDDDFVKAKFTDAFDKSGPIRISKFPRPAMFANGDIFSESFHPEDLDRLNFIINLSEHESNTEDELSFFIMFGSLLRSKFSFITEHRNFSESNDLGKLPLKDDGSNLHSYLFWLKNSSQKDEQARYSKIRKVFEDVMQTRNHSFESFATWKNDKSIFYPHERI